MKKKDEKVTFYVKSFDVLQSADRVYDIPANLNRLF